MMVISQWWHQDGSILMVVLCQSHCDSSIKLHLDGRIEMVPSEGKHQDAIVGIIFSSYHFEVFSPYIYLFFQLY